jgi:hypothetical protein
MDPRHLFVDERLKDGGCVYCGAPSDTVDHVPSKVLLDSPFPDNLPGVDACSTCNQGFSLDEEYLACLLDCVLSGTVSPDGLQREKVKQILVQKPSLADRLNACRKDDGAGGLIWQPEMERVRNVVVKLARGHAAYELSLPQLDDPDEVDFVPLLTMSSRQRMDFENGQGDALQGWPEIGSRAFMRACNAFPGTSQTGRWIEIQQGRYRYAVDQPGGVVVQVVLSEYLACMVEWT